LVGKLRTRCSSVSADLMDVSSTGARLAGDNLPAPGEELFLKVERLDVFGTVAWSDGAHCGISFDEPLSDGEVCELAAEADRARKLGISPAEKLVFDYWISSPSR
jgi:hypothetical protein